MLIDSEELRRRLKEKKELNERTQPDYVEAMNFGLLQALGQIGIMENNARREAQAAERVRQSFGLSEDEWADRHNA